MMKLLTFVIIVLEVISCMLSSWWMYKSLYTDNESKLNSFQNKIVGIKPDDD